MDKRNRDIRGRRSKLEADLAEAKRRSDRLIDQVADGVLSGAAIKDKNASQRASQSQLMRRTAYMKAVGNPTRSSIGRTSPPIADYPGVDAERPGLRDSLATLEPEHATLEAAPAEARRRQAEQQKAPQF